MSAPRDFIPATSPRSVGMGVWFQPIRSWHSGTYAGEGLESMPGSDDRSGCVIIQDTHPRKSCMPPLSVTHRVYWHERDPTHTISAFLSYPNGMGACDEYFWETYIDETTPRFDNEDDMEMAVIEALNQPLMEGSKP